MKRLSLVFAVGVATGALVVYALMSTDTDEGVFSGLDTTQGPPVQRQVPIAPTAAGPSSATVPHPLERLAETDPLSALDRLLRMDDGQERRRLISVVTAIWAANGPEIVLDQIRTIPDRRTREEFLRSVLFQWSMRDTKAALKYAVGLDDWNESDRGALVTTNSPITFAISPDADPFELFEIANDLPRAQAQVTRMQILQRMAAQDPARAAEFLADFPVVERRQAATTIARQYAAQDRDAALIWASESQRPEVFEAALATIALSDPYGALEIALESGRSSGLSMLASAAINSSTTTPAEFASVVMALPESGRKQQALESMTQAWLVQDLEGAVEWLVSHGDMLPAELFNRAANRLGQYPELATSYVDRVPADLRSDWIESIAGGYASIDPDGAVEWVEQFRADPAYARSVRAIAQRIVQFDGAAAARLMDSISTSRDPRDVQQLATAWAANEPLAAIQWVEGIGEQQLRESVLSGIAQVWARYDVSAAEQWARSLQSGPVRDRVLNTLVVQLFEADRVRATRLLDSFSTEMARQSTVLQIATRFVREDEAAARRLVDQYVTDQALRDQFERYLSPSGAQNPGCGAFARRPC